MADIHQFPVDMVVQVECGDFIGKGIIRKRLPGLTYSIEFDTGEISSFSELFISEYGKVNYQWALRYCREGQSSEELKKLYLSPYREQVPWILFPNWARPTDETEGAHEG